MKASELTGMSDEQLVITLRDTEKHLFQLRFQSATDRLETPSEISKASCAIAWDRFLLAQSSVSVRPSQGRNHRVDPPVASPETGSTAPGSETGARAPWLVRSESAVDG